MFDFWDTDTLICPPPPEAIHLFSGANLDLWESRKGSAARWRVTADYIEVVPGTGDIFTRDRFTDFQLHLEFWLPLMPEATGQARANSGLYLQGMYEIQILDSFGRPPGPRECGALFETAAPLRNACKKPERWQSYDVFFRAPGSNHPGSMTVLQNGILIHNNLPFHRPTRAGLDLAPGQPGPIMLQDHGNPIRFRNIWILV